MKIFIAVQCHVLTNSLIYNIEKCKKYKNIFFALHVDMKASLSEFDQLNKYENVFFVPERYDVRWGSSSQIDAVLSLMSFSNSFEYDYFFLISGDDVLVGYPSKMISYLEENEGLEFIGYESFVPNQKKILSRVKFVYPPFFFKKDKNIFDKLRVKIFNLISSVHIYDNKLSLGVDLYKGSNWFTLTRGAINLVLDYTNQYPEYRQFFENSFCGDEVFFQSILMTEKDNFKIHNGVDDNDSSLRFVDWVSGPEYPKVLSEGDFYKVFNSGCFFARKISRKLSLSILEKYFG